MLDYPLVSIGVACYNAEKYIVETLNSVKKQTYSNVELIIVDDSSVDNSVQVIEDWILMNPFPCKFIKNTENKGITKVSNLLLDNAEGEYFAILGGDDIYLPNKIKNQVQKFYKLENNVAVLYSDVFVIDEHGNRTGQTLFEKNKFNFKELPNGKVFIDLARGNFIPAASVLCKKMCLIEVGGYDESLSYEDWDMWLKLSLKYEISPIYEIGAEYRIHSSSFWQKRNINAVLSTIKMLICYLNIDKKADVSLKKNIGAYAEQLYHIEGKWRYLNIMYRNFMINKNMRSFSYLFLSIMGIEISVISKVTKLIRKG